MASQPEVARRKEARQLKQANGRLALAVAVVAAIVVVGIVVLGMRDGGVDNSENIGRLVERLSVVDETLVKADELMVNPFDGDTAEERQQVITATPAITTELNRIDVDAQTLARARLDDRETVAVEQIEAATKAREDMFDAAVRAFRYVNDADSRVAEANTMWNSVLNADQLAREAIAEANRATTKDATIQSLDKTREALDGFTSALSELRAIMQECSVDLTDQEKYLVSKVDSLQLAIATSEALLAGNRDEAKEKNEAYNAADEATAKLAEGLPPSIGGLVRNQYEDNIVAYQEVYDSARIRVIEADAVIREYLTR